MPRLLERIDTAGLAETQRACGDGGFHALVRDLSTGEVIALLASERASNVHGAIWAVDGGLTAG